ncbi:MAG: CehA/McbA family metallohydrolase, partial [Opitutaceae bacterium]
MITFATILGAIALPLLWCTVACGHEFRGHSGPTYEINTPVELRSDQKRLRLLVLDAGTGQPTAARFSLVLDGRDFVPGSLDRGGLRFTSIHTGRKERFVALYSRGAGHVEAPLPGNVRRGVVHVIKGFEYLPESVAFDVTGARSEVTVALRRWSDVRARGWVSVEEHVHYDRPDPGHDRDWLTILAADDLGQAHFMVAKDGNVPGIWAAQHAYGPKGEASDGVRLIRPGEEYRDNLQGHINLLGVREVIHPIIAGTKDHPYNWPVFFDVFTRATELDAVVGVAHGAALGRSPTAVADTILGAIDFFEIANTNRYNPELWYRLLNCGYIFPPVAGTDLPNYSSRDAWQPLFGEVRTYIQSGGRVDFDAFKAAIASGATFVSSGPMIALTVEGAGPGGVVRLPAGGGEVGIEAELSSPRELETFEIVHHGEVIPMEVTRNRDGPVNRWRIHGRLKIARSGWLAARGSGELKQALLVEMRVRQHTFAHTAPVRVLVGEEPVVSAEDARVLIERLRA